LADRAESRWLPARRVVLLDDRRADAFVEVMTVNDARDDTKLRLHALRKRPVGAAPHLSERHLEAGRRFRANGGRRFCCPVRRPAAVSSAERMPSTVSPANRRSIAGRSGASAPSPGGGSAKAASTASTGTVPASASMRSGNRAAAIWWVAIPAASASAARSRSPVSAQ